MARIPFVEPETASPEVDAVYKRFGDLGYGVFNVMKVFANDSQFLAGFEQMFQAIYVDEALAPRYREIAWLRTSDVNACHY
jgi:hypothetical protein